MPSQCYNPNQQMDLRLCYGPPNHQRFPHQRPHRHNRDSVLVPGYNIRCVCRDVFACQRSSVYRPKRSNYYSSSFNQARKAARDKRRMTEFVRRKTAENMAYYCISNNDIGDLQTNCSIDVTATKTTNSQDSPKSTTEAECQTDFDTDNIDTVQTLPPPTVSAGIEVVTQTDNEYDQYFVDHILQNDLGKIIEDGDLYPYCVYLLNKINAIELENEGHKCSQINLTSQIQQQEKETANLQQIKYEILVEGHEREQAFERAKKHLLEVIGELKQTVGQQEEQLRNTSTPHLQLQQLYHKQQHQQNHYHHQQQQQQDPYNHQQQYRYHHSF